ncbi:transcriptional regulator [Kaistia algarum]|uniref:ROK family transcriptional regulator n=1 Tax=Kaistia algarum TaxID=2083279 RepID=UPI000CE84254|nr:ROK family transcriptional regulator [Kaistia algarum]MCX5513329.1 ROK family transcriptional regulator [Kaistia algarum]PPE81219.1 transcriptional regulator [Kaistia algarum]
MNLRGTNQEFGRPYNRRIVLETIRLSAPISRSEIAQKVGLTVQTVSTITRELELQGFVRGAREAPKGRGHPPTTLALNPEGGFAIGLHVTPIGIEAALINLAGDVIARRGRTIAPVDPEAALALCGDLVRDIRAVRPDGRMLGIGMAMPGPIGVESMSFVGPTTLEGWKGVDIAARLEAATGLPAFIGLDLAAAALGDRLYGEGRAFRDFYYLYFGVGLGGTMMQDGTALRGSRGNAGEIGHIPVVPGGDLCPCGNRGCLERYLSLDALDRRLKAVDPTADVERAIRVGSPVIDAWIEETAPLLRAAVVTIENLFDPETILIGGLVPEDLLARLVAAAEPLPHSIAEHAGRTATRLKPTPGGQDAVLRGAAALAVSGVLSPRFGMLFAGEEERAPRDPIMTRNHKPEVAA